MPTHRAEPVRPPLADLEARTLKDDPSGRQETARVLGGFFRSVGGLKMETE